MKKNTVVAGTIGEDDPHIIGIKILERVFASGGFRVTNLGSRVSPSEFVKAAIEDDAALVLISSLTGHGELYCRNLPGEFKEAGLEHTLLYLGGNLVIGNLDWKETQAEFKKMGFHRVYSSGTDPYLVLEDAKKDLGIAL